jgi:hypothetical protein
MFTIGMRERPRALRKEENPTHTSDRNSHVKRSAIEDRGERAEQPEHKLL